MFTPLPELSVSDVSVFVSAVVLFSWIPSTSSETRLKQSAKCQFLKKSQIGGYHNIKSQLDFWPLPDFTNFEAWMVFRPKKKIRMFFFGLTSITGSVVGISSPIRDPLLTFERVRSVVVLVSAVLLFSSFSSTSSETR